MEKAFLTKNLIATELIELFAEKSSALAYQSALISYQSPPWGCEKVTSDLG